MHTKTPLKMSSGSLLFEEHTPPKSTQAEGNNNFFCLVTIEVIRRSSKQNKEKIELLMTRRNTKIGPRNTQNWVPRRKVPQPVHPTFWAVKLDLFKRKFHALG